MSSVTSTPKSEEDKIRRALREGPEAEQRRLRVEQTKWLPVPDVTLGFLEHGAHDSDLNKMGSAQIKAKRKSSFPSWLSQVVKHLLVCVVNFSFRPPEANDQQDDELFAEFHHANADFAGSGQPQVSEPFLPDPFSNPLPEISATTSDFLNGPPPKTITHAVRLEPRRRPAPSAYAVPAFPHVRYSDRSGCSGSRSRSRLPRPRSCTSLAQMETSQSVTASASLPDLFLKDFERFTPDITLGGPKESYRLQCFRAGRYQCTATGLAFDVDGEGAVRYSVVSWDMELLASHCKEPAGPLFDIECEGLTVLQIHLPHCEILSAGEEGHPLYVGHVRAEGLELISPEQTTLTHVVANISGCSAFGLMRDEDAPLVPIRALVAIFLEPEVPSLQVFLLPENVVLDRLRRERARNNGNERFIETISDCELVPQRQYTLASRTEPDLVFIQPDRATFYPVSHNYIPAFQIFGFGNLGSVHLTLREHDVLDSVWGAVVPLVPAAQRRRGSLVGDLRNIWFEFIRRVSMAMVETLVDCLFQAGVLSEAEEAELTSETIRRRKARLLINTVINKGEPACEMMVMFLRQYDPYNADNLGLA